MVSIDSWDEYSSSGEPPQIDDSGLKFKIGDKVMLNPKCAEGGFDTPEANECHKNKTELTIADVDGSDIYPYTLASDMGELDETFEDCELVPSIKRQRTFREVFDR